MIRSFLSRRVNALAGGVRKSRILKGALEHTSSLKALLASSYSWNDGAFGS